MDALGVSSEQLTRLAETYGIRLMLLHGSVASAQEHQDSDVDIAALFGDRNVGSSRMAELHSELQQLLPHREIDLVSLNAADPLFLKKITEKCRLLYGEPRELYSLKMYAFRRYQDHKRFLAMERRYVTELLERFPSAP